MAHMTEYFSLVCINNEKIFKSRYWTKYSPKAKILKRSLSVR